MEKKPKRYVLTHTEYRKKIRDEERLQKLKGIIDQAHRITRQIKKVTGS